MPTNNLSLQLCQLIIHLVLLMKRIQSHTEVKTTDPFRRALCTRSRGFCLPINTHTPPRVNKQANKRHNSDCTVTMTFVREFHQLQLLFSAPTGVAFHSHHILWPLRPLQQIQILRIAVHIISETTNVSINYGPCFIHS